MMASLKVIVALADEVIDPERGLYMFHPNFPYINKTVQNFEAAVTSTYL